MKTIPSPISVAVTGVGAIIGQGITKSLRQSHYQTRIVGIDRSNRSPGPYIVDIFEQKPNTSEGSPDYKDYWSHIIRKHNIQLILPGLEIDMMFFNDNRALFDNRGVKIALNQPDLISVTANKWMFGRKLSEIGYPCIPSAMPASWEDAIAILGEPPLLLKPLQGNGSRGIVLLRNVRDFDYWRSQSEADWMLQRIVGKPDQEYTVGVFGLGDGRMLGPLIFRRLLSSAGNTREAQVIPHHSIIEPAIDRLTRYFMPIGPTNFQFRIEDDKAFLLEINPRFSSSNSLRTAFGFNEAEMSIDYFLFDQQPSQPKITVGTAWRYSEDFVVHASDSV